MERLDQIMSERNFSPWGLALAGLAATLLGLGFGRFAYTPLLPALVGDGWVTGPQGALLGATNLLGYFIGAVAAAMAARHVGSVRLLRLSMALTALSLLACAWNGGLIWLGFWRLLAGITGAFLVVLAAPVVMAAVPAEKRALVAGVVFSGIGSGVLMAGFLLPAMAGYGLPLTWAMLGLIGLAMTGTVWGRWPRGQVVPPAKLTGGSRPLLLFALAYGADGMGFVPHTLFLSDFVARGLGQGVAAGGFYWALFGIGALVGPMAVARLAGRRGFPVAFTLVLAVKAAAVLLPLLSVAPPLLALSAFIVGALTPGSVTLASGVAGRVVGPAFHTAAWARMTALFALFQAAGGYGLSALFAATGSYLLLFAIGGVVLGLGALSALAATRLLAKEASP